MSKEMSGVILEIFPEKQISDKLTIKEFVFQTDEDYPQVFKVQTRGKRISILDKAKVGDLALVKYNLNGRMAKGSYFTTLDAWALDVTGGQQSSAATKASKPVAQKAAASDSDDLPF